MRRYTRYSFSLMPRRYNKELMYRIRRTGSPDLRSPPKKSVAWALSRKRCRPQNPKFCGNFATLMEVFDWAPGRERLPQPPRRDQIVQDVPGGVAKGAAASAGQVLQFDLFLSRPATDVIELMNGGGIVHAAQAGKIIVAHVIVELAREPLFFQPHVVAQKAKHLAARRQIVGQRADFGVDRPRRRAFAHPLH